ncbi:MAG TPA: hypothetical protein VKY74_19280 [Chloroflexia bacterium]|nr:hypothetical protein [Chloroflexia bacterium]
MGPEIRDIRVLYIEDDVDALRLMSDALRREGWRHYDIIDTSEPASMNTGLARLGTADDPVVCVVDGHNALRFAATAGSPSMALDLKPPFLVQWLWAIGLPPGSRLILFSNDEDMVADAQHGSLPGFAAALTKGRGLGELMALVRREAAILAARRA